MASDLAVKTRTFRQLANQELALCGLSETQPFCDGSHQRTDLFPHEFMASESKTVYFCGCKQSANGPLCGGTHKTL
jgi:CDGSH-type Zn-finger protein